MHILKTNILVSVFIPTQNIMTKMQAEEERFYSSLHFHIAVHYQQKSGLELEQVKK